MRLFTPGLCCKRCGCPPPLTVDVARNQGARHAHLVQEPAQLQHARHQLRQAELGCYRM